MLFALPPSPDDHKTQFASLLLFTNKQNLLCVIVYDYWVCVCARVKNSKIIFNFYDLFASGSRIRAYLSRTAHAESCTTHFWENVPISFSLYLILTHSHTYTFNRLLKEKKIIKTKDKRKQCETAKKLTISLIYDTVVIII